MNPDVNIKPLQEEPTRIQGTGTPRSLPEQKQEQKPKPKLDEIKTKEKKEAQEHEDQKTSLVLGFVILGLSAFIIYKLY